jgi:hypothetical protein
MFTTDVKGQPGKPDDTSLLLLPTVAKRHQSPPVEDVMLVRDEVANMVWGVENMVPMANGDTRRGREAASGTLAYLQALVTAAGPPPPPASAAAPIGYNVMTTVAENRIPFIAVHVDGSNREIQIQRAALPRILQGGAAPLVEVQPRTLLLRHGLDQTPAQPYFVF